MRARARFSSSIGSGLRITSSPGRQFAGVAITVVLGVALFAASYDAYLNLEVSYGQTYDRLAFADVVVTGGEAASFESEFYITECTWMRKHGWRTPEWKLIVALEPDFHFKPTVELYNLIEDPDEGLPGFFWFSVVRRAKPGATVLAATCPPAEKLEKWGGAFADSSKQEENPRS